MIKKYVLPFFNSRAAGLYILLFAISIGIATFIENDFGTSSAQKLVYNAWWFSLLLGLFGATIIVNIFKFRMLQQRKWALLLTHVAVIVILVGAAITRYFGFEGVMHIRENNSSSQFLSSKTLLQFEVLKEGRRFSFDEEVLFASLGDNSWSESYLVGSDLIEVKLMEFIPNPQTVIEESGFDGKPIIEIVYGGANGREEYFLGMGESKIIHNTIFNFKNTPNPKAINISYENGQLGIMNEKSLLETTLASQHRTTLEANEIHPIKLQSLYTAGSNRFVFNDFKENARIAVISKDKKVKRESLTALKLFVAVNGKGNEMILYGRKGSAGRTSQIHLEGLTLGVGYGAKSISLPFSIHLHDFIMERYPGTDNAASYASEVQLVDSKNNVEKGYRIYMNNILNYGGYRFFQSSFDRDEQGTYLSVNHDFWGSLISYIGYFLLTIGMVLSMFSKKSRFVFLQQQIKKIRVGLVTLILVFSAVFGANAQKVIGQGHLKNIIDVEHAERFSEVVVQDYNGRMKPVHTLSREILRKVARKESIEGLDADQVILGMFANKLDWLHVPMIKLGEHQALKDKLGVTKKILKYSDFFAKDGSYILQDEVKRAYSLNPVDRGTYERELLKVDERVNILNMVFSGRMFRLIPIKGDPNNTWESMGHGQHNHDDHNSVADNFFSAYQSALVSSMESGNYTKANQLIDELKDYQIEAGGAVIISDRKISLEIALNKMKVFNWLSVFYALLGLFLLFFLFFSIFNEKLNLSLAYKILFGMIVLGFTYHTMGLVIRWYISGRAPWSNGYESMIYIAWTTTLAGVIFTRKSWGGLAATMILAATILLVALLSYMDPEITPLVPVLKSYWLTIHVSLEAGSYGFLMLGAVIGIINLILLVFLVESNKDRIKRIVVEMTYLSELTLTVGLVMLCAGTYLGGIWANESWGRYWGWDAKETWALISILIYVFILHMRIIPKMYSLFSYNLATVFGMASVIMTYYGVNYYLSGLHSYASGDPVSIPQWVYIVSICILVISLLAYRKMKRVNISYK